MIQLAWRFLLHQKDSALTHWYRIRTADVRGATRKTMIVALARKLLVALWRRTAPWIGALSGVEADSENSSFGWPAISVRPPSTTHREFHALKAETGCRSGHRLLF